MKIFEQRLVTTLNYGVDWSKQLDPGEGIEESSWVVPSEGIEVLEDETHAPLHTTDLTTAWVQTGDVEQTFRIINRILTSLGKEDERSLYISVIDR